MLQLPRSSIFIKLIAAFLIVILPLYLISLLINHNGASSIKEEISRSVADRVHFYLSSLEREVDRITNMQLDYVTDQELLYLSGFSEGMSDFERNQAVLNLQKGMVRMKASSLYIKEVSAHIPRINRTITTEELQMDVNPRQLQALRVEHRIPSSPFIYWDDRLFLPLQHPSIGGEEPLFLLAIELSRQELVRTLDSIVSQMEGHAVLLNAEQHWSIGGEGRADIVQSQFERAAGGNGGNALSQWTSATIGGESYFVTRVQSETLGLSLFVTIPESEMLGSIQKYNAWIWLISAFALLIVVGFSYWIYTVIHKPLAKIMRAMRQVESGNFQVTVQPASRDEFGYLYIKFNEMVGKLDVLVNEVYEQNIRSQRSELKRLQSQINPHFLYNSFFILVRMIKAYDNDSAVTFAHYLGEYFMFITRDALETVPLSLEVKHASTYVELQTICFSGRIRAEIGEVPERVRSMNVPRLLIQPIVENAYKYAVEEKMSDGRIRIDFRLEGGQLLIIVEDNGDLGERTLEELQHKLSASDNRSGGTPSAMDETTGLINVHRRIRLRYGPDCGIEVERGDMGGLKVTITLAAEVTEIEEGA